MDSLKRVGVFVKPHRYYAFGCLTAESPFTFILLNRVSSFGQPVRDPHRMRSEIEQLVEILLILEREDAQAD
jgi:hypothetical protein